MAKQNSESLRRGAALEEEGGWHKVVVRAGERENTIERNRWCEANVGRRSQAWNAHYLKNYYFADRHHALMFKLAFGGDA